MPSRFPRWVMAITALIAVGVSLFFLSQQATLPDGARALALDDSYIHLQYARQTAQGHFLEYHTDDKPSTGATSLLYMLVVSLFFAPGATNQAVVQNVLNMGGTLFVIGAVLFADLIRRIAGMSPFNDKVVPPAGAALMGGVLFAASGWMAWVYLSGMETGLLITLVVGAMWAYTTRRWGLAAVLAALAALTRPEALILWIALAAAHALIRDTDRPVDRRQLLWWLIPLAATLVTPLISLSLTGSLSASGLQAKSLFTLVPFYPARIVGMIGATVLDLIALFGAMAASGDWHAFPLTQGLALGGFVLLWRGGDPHARRIAVGMLAWAVIGTLATATLQTAAWHHYRYQMPMYPPLLALACIALMGIAEWAHGKMITVPVWVWRLALALPIAAWGVFSVSSFAEHYRKDTRTIAEMQAPLAMWIADNTPPDAVLAAHDVGVLGYLSGRRTFDLVGLTSSGMAQSYRSGPGSEWEALANEQPDYLMIYPHVGPPFFGLEAAPALMGEEAFSVNFENYSGWVSAESTQVIAQPDWTGAALADVPQQPDVVGRLVSWELVDWINIGDLNDEAAHGYTWWNQGEPPGFPTDARWQAYRADSSIRLGDGGRLLTGGESFTIKTRPGASLILVSRLNQTADMLIDVSVDGEAVGQWKLPAVPGEWLESTFNIRGDKIVSEQTRITLTVNTVYDAPPETRYSPFAYWAYQGGALPASPSEPSTRSEASFGDAVRLLEFDLSNTKVGAGEPLTLTLFWQALNPPRARLRVFVHLVDPAHLNTAEGVVAQVDTEPYSGTLPFWTWDSNQIGFESYQLILPPDLPSGNYVLLMGIYDAATGERLAVVGGEDVGASRLKLGEILVR